MNSERKKVFIKLSFLIAFTIIIFTALSIPLISIIAPLGNILLPGTGIWRAPGEVPESEILYVNGLDDKVIVYRDEWGIPHIYAKTEDDFAFALGYLHAQDRLFQMDMARRQIRGKLSEVVGDIALESDKYNLAMGMEYWANKTAQEIEKMINNGTHQYLESFYRYTDGVNYYIDTHQNEYPVEYAILGFKPTKWSILDSLCFSKYMSKMLTWNYNDLYRLINYEALGDTDYNELFNIYQPYQIPICPNYGSFKGNESINVNPLKNNFDYPKINSKISNTISRFLEKIEDIESERQLIELQKENLIGSNNWVVDGVKSSTGKPILCNDMHLAWGLPGIWYEAHAVVEDTNLNIYGFTLAGVPLAIVGHNDKIAWGFTNTNYDVIDWYYFKEIDDNHYIYNGTQREYNTREYKIKVKGSQSVDFVVKETILGPVLSDFLDDDEIPDSMKGDNIVIVPQWTGNRITHEFIALYGFNHAQNRKDFNQSSEWFENPAQNMVYADIYGNIAIRPTGLVPTRQGNGTFPYNGSAGEGLWKDFIDFKDLPHTENPTQHYLVSANQIAVGPNYTKDYGVILQNGYAPGYRARRINELLNNSANGTVSVETMKEIQNDVKSIPAENLVPYLINVIENMSASDRTNLINDALTQLKNWNFKMDKDLNAPSIYRKWRDLYMDYTFKDEFDAKNAARLPSLNVLEKLTKEKPNSKWFDDISTTDKVESRDDIILKAFLDALEFLKDFYGTDDVCEWKYGEMHKLYFPHILDLETFSKGPYEGSGERYTVNPSGFSLGDDPNKDPGTAQGGASERMIVDFSNLQNSISC
ncbi:MAG: penicillin acylase family protein, partial [Promethearchaeota archaeon]